MRTIPYKGYTTESELEDGVVTSAEDATPLDAGVLEEDALLLEEASTDMGRIIP